MPPKRYNSAEMGHLPATPRDYFYTGRVMFRRFESDHCKKLYQNGYTVYQIKEMYYRKCTLREIIVATRVGRMECWYEDLNSL